MDPVIAGRVSGNSELHVVINGTGRFVAGGTLADTGVTGRKIVPDSYGPRVPVGGGAFSGKDPSKVDRTAAYMARHIAKSVVAREMARECTVVFAFAIGQKQPESLTVITNPPNSDAARWVAEQFQDLRAEAIAEYLDLRCPDGRR